MVFTKWNSTWMTINKAETNWNFDLAIIVFVNLLESVVARSNMRRLVGTRYENSNRSLGMV